MADKEKEIKEHYEKNLKAVEYHKELLRILHEAGGFLEFMFTFLHEVIHSGRFKGTKVLEIGSGATVYGIASASAVFPNIVQSDFVSDNREELKRWLRGESRLDWSDFLKIMVRMEGYDDDVDVGVQLMETRIRKSVKCVVKSDVLSDPVLPLDELKTEDTRPPYDLVITCLCLEACPPDFEGYVNALRRINKLIMPGGGLIMCGFENGERWAIEKNDYHHLELSTDDILKALEMAGFSKPDLKKLPNDPKNFKCWDYKHDSFYAVAAEKQK